MGQKTRIVGDDECGTCADQGLGQDGEGLRGDIGNRTRSVKTDLKGGQTGWRGFRGRGLRELVEEIGFDLVENGLDTAVELYAGPSKCIGADPSVVQGVSNIVVVGLFTAVFQ